MKNIIRSLLCVTKNKPRETRSAAGGEHTASAAAVGDRQPLRDQHREKSTAPPAPAVHVKAAGSVINGGPTVTRPADIVGCSQAPPRIPTGPAGWKPMPTHYHHPHHYHGSQHSGGQPQSHKRRRRGRRGRRRKAAAPADQQQVQIQPLQFITASERQGRSSDELSERPDDVSDEESKLGDKPAAETPPKVKAFNLTFLKHELDAMLSTLNHIQSFPEAKSDEAYKDDLLRESAQFGETLKGLLESVSKAESAQWSNLGGHSAAKGRRPR